MKRASMTMATLVALAVGLAACQQTTTTPEPAPKVNEFDQGVTPREPPPAPAPKPMQLGTVYFDFDRANIREDARAVLRQNAETLRSGGKAVTIEGHCDERGDEEYNLALGERRASSVRKYLMNLGVSGSQLKTISYGESKPAAMGHNEEAWQWNRRAEFKAR